MCRIGFAVNSGPRQESSEGEACIHGARRVPGCDKRQIHKTKPGWEYAQVQSTG